MEESYYHTFTKMSTTRRTRVRGTGFRKMGKFRPVLRYRAKKFVKAMPIPEKIKPEALVKLPDGVTMNIDKNIVTLTKSENSLSREFPTAMLTIIQEKNNIKLEGNSHNAKNRAIVGTLLEVGDEKILAENIKTIIAKKDRCSAGVSVPAHALFLSRVEYPKHTFNG